MIFYEPHRTDPDGGIYHQWKANLAFGPHLHDSFELIFVYDGSLTVVLDSEMFTVAAGQAILIFPNQIHTGSSNEHTETYLCIFHNSLVGEYYRCIQNMAVSHPVFDISGTDIIHRIVNADGRRWLLKAHLYEAIALFEEQCGQYLPRQNRTAERIGQILVFIAEHHTENISMQHAATQIGYDHHYLSNLLQMGLHTTFRALLNEYRISHAKYLLTTTAAPIAAIAQDVGYESLCSFNRNFRQLTKETPSAYRQRYRMRAVNDRLPP